MLERTTPLFGSDYSNSTENLYEIAKLLRHCGIERVVPPLPKIAVIGNQSAGKSSLIEAISKINVPRSKGTTTRCPMEFILRAKGTDNWSCTVKLRYENPSDTPRKIEPGTYPFAETQNPQDVSLIIRRAQLAILNPSQDSKDFLDMDEEQCRKHPSKSSFSRNMVVVEITGADVDVTFIDLPGIIANTEGEDVECIDMITELARSYAQQEQCLILVTASMEGNSKIKPDLETQGALRIAKECDPSGSRTFVAFTKADRVQAGDHEHWLEILHKESTRRHFVVRLHAPDTERSIKTWEDDRKEEDKLLGNQPWCKADKKQLGVKNLIAALSVLPTLRVEINEKLTLVQHDLNSLPESFAENSQAKLLNLCAEFNASIKEWIIGDGEKSEFFEKLYTEFESLATSILATQPEFDVPKKKPTQQEARTSGTKPVILLTTVPESFPKPPQPPQLLQSQSGIQVGEQRSQSSLSPGKIPLETVRDMIKKKSIRHLPGHIPSPVVEHFIGKFVSKWLVLCLHSFQETETLLQNLVDDLSVEFFERFGGSGLLKEVKTVASAVLKNIATKTRDHIKLICELESHRPFTLNLARFSQSRTERMTDFIDFRNDVSSVSIARTSYTIRDRVGNFQSHSQEGISDDVLLGHLYAKGFKISDVKELARLHGPDEYETEFIVISDILAYFEIASQRIIDIMPMVFEVVFAREFESELRKTLISKLNLLGDKGTETCAEYTRDTEYIRQKREKLIDGKKVLLEAMQILRTS